MVNLTDAYAGDVISAKRGFALSADYTQLVISDSFTLASTGGDTSTVAWSMHTYANITVDADGRGATLAQSGRKLRASVDASTGAGRFTAVDLNITALPSNQVRCRFSRSERICRTPYPLTLASQWTNMLPLCV